MGSGTRSWRVTTTVRPAAAAIRIADRRLIVNAGVPSGASTTEATQPTSA
jgi:hypothetical protein